MNNTNQKDGKFSAISLKTTEIYPEIIGGIIIKCQMFKTFTIRYGIDLRERIENLIYDNTIHTRKPKATFELINNNTPDNETIMYVKITYKQKQNAQKYLDAITETMNTLQITPEDSINKILLNIQ